jgi:predicted dehydrogenase
MIPSRRSFLGGLAALSASDRLTMAAIGAGPRGLYVLSHFLKERDVRFVAVADCFAERRRKAKEMVDQVYGASDCASYRHHERILERKDIDAVLIATGDRWHAVLSCLAAQAGKDVYSEKPFSLTIAEGRALVDTMKRTGRIWQCGTQRKSIPGYGFVRDVVRGGRIGKLHSITTSFGDGWRGNAVPVPEREPDPEVFDYDRWLGQSPWAPYSKVRVSMWRLNWDTSGGAAVDMGPHFFEFAQWVRGDELTGPVEFEGEGKFREEKGINNIPYYFTVRARYADGTRLNMDIHKKGVRFDGYDGYIQLFDEGQVEAEPRSVLAGLTPPEGHWKIMQPHIRNFIDCVRSRKEPVSGPETSQRAHTIAHCANICLRLGRRLRWDPVRERFEGDEEANRMLLRPMRAPWRI